MTVVLIVLAVLLVLFILAYRDLFVVVKGERKEFPTGEVYYHRYGSWLTKLTRKDGTCIGITFHHDKSQKTATARWFAHELLGHIWKWNYGPLKDGLSAQRRAWMFVTDGDYADAEEAYARAVGETDRALPWIKERAQEFTLKHNPSLSTSDV